jgi:hypothetical protein
MIYSAGEMEIVFVSARRYDSVGRLSFVIIVIRESGRCVAAVEHKVTGVQIQ